MSRRRGAVFVPFEDYLDMNFQPHEKTRPGAPAAKHSTETGRPTSENRKEHEMSEAQNTRVPAGFEPQFDWDPETGEPEHDPLYYQGPELIEPGLSLNAIIRHPGGDISIFDDRHNQPVPLDALPGLAAKILRFHSDLLAAQRGESL